MIILQVYDALIAHDVVRPDGLIGRQQLVLAINVQTEDSLSGVCDSCRWPLDGVAGSVRLFGPSGPNDAGRSYQGRAYVVCCRRCCGVADGQDRPPLAPSGRRYSVLRTKETHHV